MNNKELSSIISNHLKKKYPVTYTIANQIFDGVYDFIGEIPFSEIQNNMLEMKILYLVTLFIINDPEQKMYLTFAYNASGETICHYSFDQIIFYVLTINCNRMDAFEAITIRKDLVNFKGGSIFDMFGKEYV